MRRWVWGLIVVVCIFSGVSGAKDLELWMVGWSNEMAKIAQRYIDEYTAISGHKVRVVGLAWGDYYNKSLLALASKDTPDIFSLGSEIADFALRGGLIDLAKFKPKEYQEVEKNIFTSLMGPFSFQASRFAVPVSIDAHVAAYRVDLLNEMGMGIPETWDDIRDWQQKVLARGKTLAYTNFDNIWGAYTHITQNGGQFFGPDGFSSALDRPESIKGFTEFVELYTKHKLPQTLAGVEPFIRGEQLSIIDGLWLHSTLNQAAPSLAGKWQIGLIPGVRRDGKVYHGSFAGSVLLGISAFSKNQEEAWDFLKWFLSSDVQLKISNSILNQNWVWMPANKEAMSKIDLKPEIRDVYYKQIEACTPVPYAVNALVQYRFVVLALQKCVTQNADPKATVLEAAKEMNNEMTRRKKEYSRFLENVGK